MHMLRKRPSVMETEVSYAKAECHAAAYAPPKKTRHGYANQLLVVINLFVDSDFVMCVCVYSSLILGIIVVIVMVVVVVVVVVNVSCY